MPEAHWGDKIFKWEQSLKTVASTLEEIVAKKDIVIRNNIIL